MIETIDIVICLGYIVFIIILGLWAGLKKRPLAEHTISQEYFLAGKSVKWPVIGLSLFATNISCLHLVSLAQSGYDTGLLNGNFEWMAGFTLILLAWIFIPFYIKSGITTLPDYLEKRYNRACRDWLTIISIVSAIVVHIAFSFLAGGIVLESLFDINLYVGIIIIAFCTGLYTIIGGLRSVVVTESIQTLVLLAGAIILTVICYQKVGGWQVLTDTLKQTGNEDKLSMVRPIGDESGLSWLGVVLGYPIIGIWYWCADQTIVQRVLGAKDERHAKLGALFSGFIKILPVFLFILPGLLVFVLAQKGLFDTTALSTLDGYSTKGIYTLMITQLVPSGLMGVMAAALISGLMSQISGALNSIATLISYDIFKRNNPAIGEKKLVLVGRVSAGIALLVSIILLPLINNYESLFIGINDIIAHLAPPITTVFLVGVFWKKASPKAAQYTLWVGSLLGALVYAGNKLYPGFVFGDASFLLVSFYLFVFCVLFQVLLSYLFPVNPSIQLQGLYWENWQEPFKIGKITSWGDFRVISLLLVLALIGLYIFFR